MIKEHELVALTKQFPEHRLEVDDIGTVVHCYEGGRAFEVEFMLGGGETIVVLTLESEEVRALRSRDVLHARRLAA
jgi:hypothetical protein